MTPRRALSTAALVASSLAVAAACGPNTRDVVPVTPETRADGGATGSASGDAGADLNGYMYIAKTSHGAVGLADSRGMPERDAISLVAQLARDFDACATKLQNQGVLVRGAGRFLAVVQNGRPVYDAKLEPGDRVAQNALLCVMAPLKSYPIPGTADGRGLAIEIAWDVAGGP
jgi:hypothetical protein